MNLIVLPTAFFITSLALTFLFRKLALHWQIIDHPNARSSHIQDTPRAGGIVFTLLWFLICFGCFFYGLLSATELKLITLGTGLVALIGLIDDIRGLSNKLRFAGQVIAAMIFLDLAPALNLQIGQFNIESWLVIPLSIWMIVWSINLFNFMDGLDGFAATEAIFVTGFSCFIFSYEDMYNYAAISGFLLPLIAGFLIFNKPPAKIFMGDCGSYFLGFTLIMFPLLASYHQISLLPWLIVYSLFWLDATLTLVKRFIRGEKWYQSHRSHAYQLLHHKLGWSHRQVLSSNIVINSILFGLATIAYRQANYAWPLFFGVTIGLTVIYWILVRLTEHETETTRKSA